MPCEIEVRLDDGLPVGITTPHPVADGRYTLLAPGWDSDVVRVKGEWQFGQQTLKPGRDERAAPLTEREKKLREVEAMKRLKSFGKQVVKSFLKDIRKRDDRDHER